MTSFIKGVALLVAVACVVWVAVLWRWETTRRALAVDDIVIYLGLLPLVMFGFVLALRWAWRSAVARQGTAAAAAAAAPQPATAAAATEAERPMRLLAARALAACGGSVADILAAVQEGQPRPAPDADLRDADGLPVLTARIEALKVDELTAAIAPLIASVRAQRPEFASLDMPEHALRALAALADPLQQALLDLSPWHELLGVESADRSPPPSAKHGTTQSLLRVVVGWPVGWSNFSQAVGNEWLRSALSTATPVPPLRQVVQSLAGPGTALWLEAERLLLAMARDERRDVLLLAACHSDLSNAAVDALDAGQRLFSAQRRPRGVMPGEAAVVLLLAPFEWPADAESDEPALWLHRAAIGQRDKSVEAAGRISSSVLADLAQQAIAVSRLPPAEIAMLVCDADQHTRRGTELFGVTLELLPHLDAAEDLRLSGAMTGDVGAASVLLVVAAAAQLARSEGKPCLVLALAEPQLRLALVARPQPAAA